jgi:hypothetical protein
VERVSHCSAVSISEWPSKKNHRCQTTCRVGTDRHREKIIGGAASYGKHGFHGPHDLEYAGYIRRQLMGHRLR